MDFPFPVREVPEGAARLLVPDVPRRKGPGTAGPWPFYNPTMAVNRDMSAIVLARWPHPVRSALDGLAATGAWGIRMSLEAGVPKIVFNERSSAAADLIRENLVRNGIEAHVLRGEFADCLTESPSDFVDIDPFGPPTPFLDAALESASVPSGLGITATDTAVLAGTYPEACQRRYGARPLRCDQGAEIGVRILLAYTARLAAQRGKAIHPVLAFVAEHFVRIFVVVREASGPIPVSRLQRRESGAFVEVDEGEAVSIGPIWLGPLEDPVTIRAIAVTEWTRPSTARLLSIIQGESDLPPLFVTTDELASRERGSPPKRDRFIEALRSIGYRAARTHFHPRGVKTDAPHEDIARVFRERMPSGSTDG